MWKSLKSYLPRSLYGRSALILIAPVVAIQLVVSIIFIQRHFDGAVVAAGGARAAGPSSSGTLTLTQLGINGGHMNVGIYTPGPLFGLGAARPYS